MSKEHVAEHQNSLAICVYCGSGNGRDPRYAAAATQLGQAIAAAGHRLVYGGGNSGLMGAVARAVKAGGGHVTGIIPRFLITKEKLMADSDEIILVDDMHQRKMKMFELSNAFVALPGGIGTLEELVEQMTWSQLGRHRKAIIMVDIAGFWRPMMNLMAHMRMEGFIREGLEIHTQTAEKVEDIVPMIESWVKKHGKSSGQGDWSPSNM